MKLYKKIKEIRECIDMKQGEFAKKIGFSRIAVSHWEQGLKMPRFDAMIEIYKLAKRRGVYITFEDFI
jgi:DNA-binding transcriptional regulator YiaG